MTINMEHFPEKNSNPVLCVAKDGTVIYSNEAAKPLLIEWGAKVGDKLPSNIVDLVQRVVARNIPEKLEVKAGNRVFLISLHHLPEEECVNIYGFDISDYKELEEKLRESEKKYRNIVETSAEGIWVFNEFSETTYVNEKMSEMLGYSREEMIGRFIWDFAYEEDKGIFQVKLENRKQGKDEVYELKLLRKDGLPLWVSVSAKGFFDDVGKFKGSVAMFTDITERMQMEEQTRHRVEELETLMDIVPAGIFIGHDSKCLNITGNKMANELLEAKSGENVSVKISHILHIFHDDIELTADELPMQKAAYKDINVRNEEFDLLLPSGEQRGLLGSASPLHDAEGNVRGSVGIFIDITERKKAEAKLEETLENLEKLIKERTEDLQKAYNSLRESEKGHAEAQKMAHIGNWEWEIATNKTYWSEEMYRIFKRDPQKSPPSLKEYYGYIHPDDLDYYCKATDNTRKVSTSGFNFRIVLANGEERTLHMKSDFIYNDENIPIRVKGIVQDITESKKDEEKIRYLANIVESSIDAIGTISLNGIITSWNKGAERIYGFSAEEILGKHVSILSPSHLKNETMNEIKKSIELIKLGESYYHYETLRLGKNGKEIYISVTYSPIFDTNGKLTAISIIGRDITEHKRAEEALRNFEIASKKEIHHRIKNNLQVISSLLDLQADLFKGRKSIQDSEVLKAFKQSIDRVFSIALIHEELYKGKNIDQLNFSQYIGELVNNLLLTYRLETTVCLNLDLEENIFLDIDIAIPLGIIINEIITNSFKYAFSGMDKGEIRIELHREENGENKSEGLKNTNFSLSISDNGVGIPEDLDVEELDSLGMQLITTLVDQLDGELEIKRDNGTKFIIRFTVTEKDNWESVNAPQMIDND